MVIEFCSSFDTITVSLSVWTTSSVFGFLPRGLRLLALRIISPTILGELISFTSTCSLNATFRRLTAFDSSGLFSSTMTAGASMGLQYFGFGDGPASKTSERLSILLRHERLGRFLRSVGAAEIIPVGPLWDADEEFVL
uniref:Uncharacterized protein n=1 Tax=Anopheles dirus TaxID=7168 RepID=A0A182NYM6_9DIPT